MRHAPPTAAPVRAMNSTAQATATRALRSSSPRSAQASSRVMPQDEAAEEAASATACASAGNAARARGSAAAAAAATAREAGARSPTGGSVSARRRPLSQGSQGWHRLGDGRSLLEGVTPVRQRNPCADRLQRSKEKGRKASMSLSMSTECEDKC